MNKSYPCFSFSCCNTLFPYHLGVAKKLYNFLGNKLEQYVFAGTSEGAVVALLLSLNIDPDIYANYAFKYHGFLNPTKTFINVLDNFMIDNNINFQRIINKVNKRCQITVTQLPYFKQIDINEYKDINDLKNWLNATCTSPVLNKWLPTIVNSRLYIDGGVSCIHPKWKQGRITITISVIDPINSDIYPSIPLHKLDSLANFSDKNCYQMYLLGINDCTNWLENNKKIFNDYT